MNRAATSKPPRRPRRVLRPPRRRRRHATTATRPAPTKTPLPGKPSKAAGVVLDFESETAWRRGTQPYGDLTRVTDPVHSGAYSAKLAYNFPAVKDNFVVFQARPAIPIAGQPAALYAWVYGDSSGHMLNAWLGIRKPPGAAVYLWPIKHQGWLQMTAPLDDAGMAECAHQRPG